MSNCKHCNEPIESHTGRRPKLYCNEVCRNAYFNAQKSKKSTKVWKSTYDEVVLENKALKARIKELEAGNPVLNRGVLNLPPINGSDSPALEGAVSDTYLTPGSSISNVDTGAKIENTSKKVIRFAKAKMKDFDGANTQPYLQDEMGQTAVPEAPQTIFTPTKEDEIARLEGEIALLGKGSVASQRKNFLQKQIDKLKYS